MSRTRYCDWKGAPNVRTLQMHVPNFHNEIDSQETGTDNNTVSQNPPKMCNFCEAALFA